MSQSTRSCPMCGASVPVGQRFCNNCGADLQAGPAASPASQYGGPAPQGQQGQQGQPPYAQAPYGQQPGQYGQQYGQYGQQPMQPYQQPQRSNPIAEALGALGLLFFMRRFRPGYRPRRQSSGCCGCLVLLIILAIVVGIPGYFYYKAHPTVFQQIGSQFQHNTPGSNNGTPASSPIPTTTIKTGQTVNYEGVDITIVDVKQATAFGDDTAATNGVIRLDLKESAGQQIGVYSYSEILRLILPDGTKVPPINDLYGGNPQTNATRNNNWVDFQVSTSIKPGQMQLVVGSPQDAQIQFALTGKVDAKYLPKTSSPNVSFTYAGMQWTITKAAITYSTEGRQATTGNIYVTLSFHAVNNTNNTFINNTDSYMRMKAGGTLNPPVDNGTLTNSFQPSSTNTGDVSFLVPQGNSSFTLEMLTLPGTNPPVDQVTQNFQV